MIRSRGGLFGAVLLVAMILVPARDASAEAGTEGPAENEPAPAAEAKPYGLRVLGRDSKYLLTRPWHLDRRGWAKVGVTVGVAATLFVYREEVRDFAQAHRTPEKDQFLANVRGVMGGPGLAMALSLGTFTASFATHSDRERETAQLLLESLGYSSLFAGIGQFVLASERPREGDDVHFFKSHGHGVSGDAAIAASIVAPLRRQYLIVAPEDGHGIRFLKRAGTGILYAGAILTGWQRVTSDAHWAPDAFLGLAIGFATGEILCDAHAKAREHLTTVAIAPSRGGGLSILVRFEPGAGSHERRVAA